jgi:tRNA uridine 5-carboxymethylaminomethyl modification enzyme
MGCETLLFNINLDAIALMSCNPAIGGLAKSQLVKEVDALGGQMGRIADKTAVHFRLLNASKGPAVQSTRFQCDKQLYRLAMKTVLEKQERLHLRQGLVESLAVEDGRIRGVVDQTGVFFGGRAVVITTGTFLSGLIHVGDVRYPAGRAGEIASLALAENHRTLSREGGRIRRDSAAPPRGHHRLRPPPPQDSTPTRTPSPSHRTAPGGSATPPNSPPRRPRPPDHR